MRYLISYLFVFLEDWVYINSEFYYNHKFFIVKYNLNKLILRNFLFNSLFCLLVWMYIGLIGGVLFIFIQVIYLIDVAHSWTESWYESLSIFKILVLLIFLSSDFVLY